MLLLALFTATLASQLSRSSQLLEARMLNEVKQGIQSITQEDIDANPRGGPIKVTPGESVQQVRQALMSHYMDLIKIAESQKDPNAAVRQLYEMMRLDDHSPSSANDAKLAVIEESGLKAAAAVTQHDIDTNPRGFNPDLHVTAGMPVEEVRQRMRQNLTKLLQLAASNSQLLDAFYDEARAEQQYRTAAAEAFNPRVPYTGSNDSADALYKYDVERTAYSFKNGGYSQEQLVALSKSPYFKNAKLDNVSADKLGKAEFNYVHEQLKNARDNNNLEYLRIASQEG